MGEGVAVLGPQQRAEHKCCILVSLDSKLQLSKMSEIINMSLLSLHQYNYVWYATNILLLSLFRCDMIDVSDILYS